MTSFGTRRPPYWRWDRDTDALTPASGFIDWSPESRRVDQTEIQQPDAWRIPDEFLDGAQQEPIWVSTVFLCLDHWLGDETDPRPVLFETMVFGMPEGHELHEYNFNRRYHTAEEARKGHEEVVELVGKAIRATLTEATP